MGSTKGRRRVETTRKETKDRTEGVARRKWKKDKIIAKIEVDEAQEGRQEGRQEGKRD